MPKAFSHEDRTWACKKLGLAGEPGLEDLKRVHKKLVFENHTDRGGSLERVKVINQAFDILKTPPPLPRAVYTRAPQRPVKPTKYFAARLKPKQLSKGTIIRVDISGHDYRIRIPEGTSLNSVCTLDCGSYIAKIYIELDTSFGPLEKGLILANIVFWCLAFYLTFCLLGWCG
jgi:hypothetical protein